MYNLFYLVMTKEEIKPEELSDFFYLMDGWNLWKS